MTSKELVERIRKFVLEVISLLNRLPRNEENRIFTKQIIRSVSSIGANYAEAIYAHTKQDFLHIINICRKETNETLYWLDLIYSVNPSHKDDLTKLIDEGTQLLRIFISSVKTTKGGSYNAK